MGVTGDLGVAEFLRDLSAPTPTPGAGGALAISAAAAASLTQMTARISADRGGARLDDARLGEIAEQAKELSAEAATLGDADAAAYGAVLEAMRLDKGDPERAARVTTALSAAADPPLQLAKLGAEIAELALDVVTGGRSSIRGDAIASVLLAEAASCGASRLVAIDVESASDPRVARAAENADRALAARATALRS